MDFKSHLGRSMDFRNPHNLIVGVLVVIAGVSAVVLWLDGDPAEILMAPVLVFLVWAVLREIDPDHPWSALVGGSLAGLWALTGGPSVSAFALAGLLVAARIITHTTGRRPLPIDLAFATVFGIAIGFTVEGWAAGFGIAVAIYLDERFRGTNRMIAIAASALAAIGTTLVASATSAFSERAPDVIEYMVVMAGIAALILLARDPAAPTSQVDARHAAFIDKVRLHVSRSLIGVLAFLMTILAGSDAEGMMIIIVALVVAVVSNELELLRRRRL